MRLQCCFSLHSTHYLLKFNTYIDGDSYVAVVSDGTEDTVEFVDLTSSSDSLKTSQQLISSELLSRVSYFEVSLLVFKSIIVYKSLYYMFASCNLPDLKLIYIHLVAYDILKPACHHMTYPSSLATILQNKAHLSTYDIIKLTCHHITY